MSSRVLPVVHFGHFTGAGFFSTVFCGNLKKASPTKQTMAKTKAGRSISMIACARQLGGVSSNHTHIRETSQVFLLSTPAIRPRQAQRGELLEAASRTATPMAVLMIGMSR
jgi:hypothetical protein